MALEALSGWTSEQKKVVVAAFLGWTLDAFDYFLMVFILKDIADEFKTDVKSVSVALLLTLAARPIGAFLFGRAADRFGRRPVMMVDVLCYAVLGFATAFAGSLGVLLLIRFLFGVAMGGEWGIGASLAMESIPPKARGLVSGLLQAGYPTGYLIATIVYGLLFDVIGWRGLLMIGIVPALLIFFIRRHVPESPAWKARQTGPRESTVATAVRHWKIAVYAIVLMTAFNFFSHGSQDLYPTFLRVQHKFPTGTISTIAICYNVAAIVGGILFGIVSQRIGRRWAIVIAALIALPVLPLWALPADPVWLAIGAMLMQISVQGAWGVIPVHLNELSPGDARGTFPGFVYQLGNLLAAVNSYLQASIAEAHGNDYSLPLMLVVGVVAVVIAVLTFFGVERKDVSFAQADRLAEA